MHNKKNRKSTHIALTGGGTAGHVSLHLALMASMQARGWQLSYVGSKGIERELIAKTGLPFFVIASGKLRRYLSVENVLDIFRVFLGLCQSLVHFLAHRPDAVFSKGGFVSVPVVVAAWILRIPVIIHESDVTPGLANRIAGTFAKKIMYSFPETAAYLQQHKSVYVGPVVRSDLLSGDRSRGLALCGFDPADGRKNILIIGGSQGAQKINEAIEQALDILCQNYRVIHLTGKGKMIGRKNDRDYAAFEFLSEELKDIFAAADLAVGRAGANSIFELLALNKPMLLIPLEAGSRGDQLLNARSFEKKQWAQILREADLNSTALIENIKGLDHKAMAMMESQRQGAPAQAREQILDIVESCV